MAYYIVKENVIRKATGDNTKNLSHFRPLPYKIPNNDFGKVLLIQLEVQKEKGKAMETTRTVRLPTWLDDVCKEVITKVGADNFSDYIRGVILKHAVSLDIPVPPVTQAEWPEWALKPRKEMPPREIPREIKGF